VNIDDGEEITGDDDDIADPRRSEEWCCRPTGEPPRLVCNSFNETEESVAITTLFIPMSCLYI
jgi:hypothetical protein